MAEAEKGWPVFIRDRTQEPVHPAPPQWSCRQPPVVWRGKPAPEAGETEPLHQPFKITCQAKDEACE